MIGRNGSRAIDLSGSLRRGTKLPLFADWRGRVPGNRYSRRVAFLKVALPAIGVSLFLLVVVWPRIAPLFDRLHSTAIDLREARELRMINPRYAGTDRNGRPFVVTAAIGRQVPRRDDVMSLDQPVADVQSHGGAKMVISADSGVYQTQTQFLDMFGKVTIDHENGAKIVTDSARLDVANSVAEGHSPVEGHGPQGDLAAQGFQLLDKGNIVIFTGQSNLLLNSAKQQASTVVPAALPAPVAQAAAQIEQKAGIALPAPPPPAPAKSVNPAPAKTSNAAPAKSAKQSSPAPAKAAPKPTRNPG